jgi:heme/copper-type cytochrome/quinol oxidase subunit 2
VAVQLSRDGRSRSDTILLALVLVTVCGTAYLSGRPQEAVQAQRSFAVVARRYAFAPVRIEVAQDDLVKVTMTSADIAHSFTIDAYRIDKRVGPKQSVTFEFRANQPGTFRIYCKLTQDERCKEMHGELVVIKRQ